jgi:hypothetical protein
LVNRNLVGRCGLYCGACTIHRAYEDDGEYLKKVAEYFKCPPEKVQCEGCMALTPDSWGYNCKIVNCLRSKGLEFCYQCGEYENRACEKFEKLAKGYLEDGEDIRANLERIKKDEIEQWLRESEELYKCSTCGRPLPVSRIRGKCYHCGADLSNRH